MYALTLLLYMSESRLTVMTAMTPSKMAAFAKAFQAMVPASSLFSWNGVYTKYTPDFSV